MFKLSINVKSDPNIITLISKTPSCNNMNIYISKSELIWSYLRMGRLSKGVNIKSHLKYIIEYVDYIFDCNSTTKDLKLNNFLHSFDQSMQSSIAYLNGMILCTLVAYKMLGIRFLYHFSQNKYKIYKSGIYIPDLIGESFQGGNNKYFVFEAKSTFKNKISNSVINHAFSQVNSVRFVNGHIPEKYVSLATVQTNNDIVIDFIDPEVNGNQDYNIDEDVKYFYYQLYDAFKNEESEEKVVDDLKFIGIYVDDYFIGMDQRLEDIISNENINITKKINDIYSFSRTQISESIFKDGFVVMNCKKK